MPLNSVKTRITVSLCIAAFFGMLSYPFVRTSAAPFFNMAYGSENLSYAMIGSAALALVLVSIYNWFTKHFKLLPLCASFFILVCAVSIVFAGVIGKFKWVSFLYYAWSDVYIVILSEQFWSITNTIFDTREAKKLYGLFLTMGALGSLVGDGLVTMIAPVFGAVNMVYLNAASIAVFVLAVFVLINVINSSDETRFSFEIEKDIASHSFFGGFTHLIRSHYLLIIGLMILGTQTYINGAYYLYNLFLANQSTSVNIQTALYGKIFFIIQIVTLFFNIVAAPLVFRFLGLGKTHYSMVLAIIALLITAVSFPSLALLAMLFILAKSFDYSIFRAAKEMFYIPLTVAEKFQGKTFIDVFIYRFSKAFAALVIILLTKTLNLSVFYLVGVGVAIWLTMVVMALKRYTSLLYKRTPD